MQEMRKEIERQEKEDPTNPKNILSILEKDREKSLKKLSSSRSMPCIKPEDDIPENDFEVEFGNQIIELSNESNVRLCDIETGEDIRPQFFTTNREIANVPNQTGTFNRIDPVSRLFFSNMFRNRNNF